MRRVSVYKISILPLLKHLISDLLIIKMILENVTTINEYVNGYLYINCVLADEK